MNAEQHDANERCNRLIKEIEENVIEFNRIHMNACGKFGTSANTRAMIEGVATMYKQRDIVIRKLEGER
jgi:hypothetical protein